MEDKRVSGNFFSGSFPQEETESIQLLNEP